MQNRIINRFGTFGEAERWLSANGYSHTGGDGMRGHLFQSRDDGRTVRCVAAMTGGYAVERVPEVA